KAAIIRSLAGRGARCHPCKPGPALRELARPAGAGARKCHAASCRKDRKGTPETCCNIWRTEQLGMKPAARWLSTTCVGCGMSLAWQICDANAETCTRIHAYAFVGWSTRNRALLPRPINDTS